MSLRPEPLQLTGRCQSSRVLKAQCPAIRHPEPYLEAARKLSSLLRLIRATKAPATQYPMQLEAQGPHITTPQLPSAQPPALQLSPQLAPAGSPRHAGYMQSISMRPAIQVQAQLTGLSQRAML